VTLSYGQDELLVRVADDGGAASTPANLPRYHAKPANPEGHGLTGMRERAVMYGGTLQAGPRSGTGFEVTVRLPLKLASRGAA
jgi:signal transduction histidine kinase